MFGRLGEVPDRRPVLEIEAADGLTTNEKGS